MSAPQPLTPAPHLYPYQRAAIASLGFGGRRWGKTDAMRQAMQQLGQAASRSARAMRGLSVAFIIHDEHFRSKLDDIDPIERPDRSHYERGGRYRKPPVTNRASPPEPGMVQLRDRCGDLVWRKIGAGMAHATDVARMRSNELWGQF